MKFSIYLKYCFLLNVPKTPISQSTRGCNISEEKLKQHYLDQQMEKTIE